MTVVFKVFFFLDCEHFETKIFQGNLCKNTVGTMAGVRQHLSLLGPIFPALTALWKCQFTSHFQNLFPGSLAISLGNDLVGCAAASAWTDR